MDHIPGLQIQDGAPAAVRILLFQEIPARRKPGRVLGKELHYHPGDPPVRRIPSVALPEDPAHSRRDDVGVIVGQRGQKLPVAVLNIRLAFVLAVPHFQHFSRRCARKLSPNTFQFRYSLMDPVFHKKDLRGVKPRQNTVSSQERQSFDQFVRLSEPLAVVDPALKPLSLSCPPRVQPLIVAHHFNKGSSALPLLPRSGVAPSPVNDLHRDLDLLIGRPEDDPPEIASRVKSVFLHFISENTCISYEVASLQNCRRRRQKRAGHSHSKLRVAPSSSSYSDPVFRGPRLPAGTSDLQDLRPDLFYIGEKLNGVLPASSDQELLHILLIAGILREPSVQHSLFFRDQRLREILSVKEFHSAPPVLVSKRQKPLSRRVPIWYLLQLSSRHLRRHSLGPERNPVLAAVGHDPYRPLTDISIRKSPGVKPPADPVRILRETVPS